MFEHVALMETFRVLTQCVMITGIKIRASLFFFFRSHFRANTHDHQLLKSTQVDLIGKERVDIFHFFVSSIVQEKKQR